MAALLLLEATTLIDAALETLATSFAPAAPAAAASSSSGDGSSTHAQQSTSATAVTSGAKKLCMLLTAEGELPAGTDSLVRSYSASVVELVGHAVARSGAGATPTLRRALLGGAREVAVQARSLLQVALSPAAAGTSKARTTAAAPLTGALAPMAVKVRAACERCLKPRSDETAVVAVVVAAAALAKDCLREMQETAQKEPRAAEDVAAPAADAGEEEEFEFDGDFSLDADEHQRLALAVAVAEPAVQVFGQMVRVVGSLKRELEVLETISTVSGSLQCTVEAMAGGAMYPPQDASAIAQQAEQVADIVDRIVGLLKANGEWKAGTANGKTLFGLQADIAAAAKALCQHKLFS